MQLPERRVDYQTAGALIDEATLPGGAELLPLSQDRIRERQEIISILSKKENALLLPTSYGFQTLQAAARADPFVRTIAPDPARTLVLSVKYDAMQFLGEAEHDRYAVDSAKRNDAMFHAVQRRIFDHYPDMESALLHPDTGVSYLTFEKLIASLNETRPPLSALLQLASSEYADADAWVSVHAFYYEGRAQQADAALKRMRALETRPDWQRRVVQQHMPDGTVKTIGEELIDMTQVRRAEVTMRLNNALAMHEQTGGSDSPLTTEKVTQLLEELKRPTQNQEEDTGGAHTEQIAA